MMRQQPTIRKAYVSDCSTSSKRCKKLLGERTDDRAQKKSRTPIQTTATGNEKVPIPLGRMRPTVG